MKRGIVINGWNVPIYNAIKVYTGSRPVPFHMPGHKLGRGIPADFLKDIAKLDLTEIPGMDNLHHPSGTIKEAQELTAAAFGADRSYFLVNGSTCGIHSIISTVCNPGDSLIVGRDSHKSVFDGMMLTGVKPVYIMPEYNTCFAVNTGIPAERVDEALAANPDAVGVLLTRPNYYGICSDIERIAGIVHAYDKILIVDEAHGSHLRFSKRLPVCAMDAGADICVQSAHKTLAAFTQGAYLHVKSDRIDTERLEFNLGIFQTSSPSYIIMAFLDIAREIMYQTGREYLDRLIDLISLNKASFDYSGVSFLYDGNSGIFKTDTTRMTINVRNLGITGYEAEKILREIYNVQVEMSDFYNIVCIATVADTADSLESLFSSLHGLEGRYAGNHPLKGPVCTGLKKPAKMLDMKEAMQAGTVRISLNKAAGRICGRIVAPYPPGIPVLCPGELITSETVEFLLDIINSGGIVKGVGENLEINVV